MNHPEGREIPNDLYDLIGVRKSATTADIRKAGKKRKVETHPDRGGDEEEFKKVNNALAVLLDPASRAEYDRSGTVRDKSPDEDNRQALALVEQELALIISEYVTKGFRPASDPRRIDVVAHIKSKLMTQVHSGNQSVPIGERHKAFLLDMQRRLKIKKTGLEGDLLHRALQRQIEMAEGNIANLKEVVRIHRLAIKLIENYDFEQIESSAMFGFDVPSYQS